MIRKGRWLAAAASLSVALAGHARGEAAAAGGALSDASESGPSQDAPSAPPIIPVFKPEEELILQVRTDKWILDQAFSGYSTPTGVYLPLGSFARLLDLAIGVDGNTGRAEGWFLDPSNSFRIDVNAGFVEVKGVRRPLKTGDAVSALGDIYVRPGLLAQWLPLNVDVSLPRQEVQLKLLTTFPFEAKMEREEKREMIGAGSAQKIAYPREKTMYEMLTPPALDVNVRATTGSGQQTTSEYDLRASGDVAFMSADLFVSGDRNDAVRDLRFVLLRRDPDRQLLGPLGLSLIEIGDTTSAQLPIGVRSRTGRGVVISNVPIDQGSVFDKIDLRGELPIGYEVELYRNDVLIGSVDQAIDGRYEFLQVPLEFGLNVLRLVFYGPHGERREEVRQINAGQDRLSAGEFQFTASAVQQDKNLISVQSNLPGILLDQGEVRAVAAAEYGLSSRMTAIGGLATFVANGKRIGQGMAGLRTNLGSAAVQIDSVLQNGGWAVQAGLAGRVLGTSYVLQHAEYGGDFTDELRSITSGDYRRYTQVRLDRAFNLGTRVLATNLVAERSEHGGFTEWDGSFRASTSISRWLLSNSFTYQRLDSIGFSTETFLGAFEVNGQVIGWGVRGTIDYDLRPGARFRDLNLAIDHELGRGSIIRATLSQQLTAGNATIAGVSLSRRVGDFDLGGDVLYDSGKKDFVVGLRASFSFGHPLGRWQLAPPGLARGGSLVAVAFSDLNGNGVQDPNEPPLEGVAFRGGAGEAKTDRNGLALISSLGDGRPAQVSMETDSLPDPYMYPTRPGVEVVPRPGRTHRALFPVVASSEVEGHAYFESDGSERVVSNVQLQLVDSKDAVVATAKTEYDGYFFIERIVPGDYRFRLDPEQAGKLGIRLAEPVPIKATANGGLVGKIAIKILRANSPAAAQ